MDKLYLKAQVESTDKGMLAIASTSVEDRHGEVVAVDGWDLKNFKKNPLLLWSHDHHEPAIGLAKNVKIEGTGKKAKLVFEPVFHEVTEKARAIKKLFEEKILNSFSVGFKPIEAEGNEYLKQELLEISAVNVPANPEARIMAYKALDTAGINQKIIKELGLEEEKTVSAEEIEAIRERIEEVAKTVEYAVKGLKHLNPHGSKKEATQARLSLAKVAAKAADKLLEERKLEPQQVSYVKVIKRVSEKLIVDQKQELKNGQDQRS